MIRFRLKTYSLMGLDAFTPPIVFTKLKRSKSLNVFMENRFAFEHAAAAVRTVTRRIVEGRTGGSLARFTDGKNDESRITDIRMSFSRITKISK